MSDWPESVERVARFLRAAGAEARLEEFDEETATAEDAAQAVGVEPAQIVKSLVCICDGRSVVALVPGDRRGDMTKIAHAARAERARVASPDEVRLATGFDPGAVAPFAIPKVLVLIDRTLLMQDALWVGAGSTRHMASLPAPELVRLAEARPADLVSDL